MTFLLDHDAPDDLEYSLQALDHEVTHLREVLPVTASDLEALSYAKTHSMVMVTCNRDDYLQLAAEVDHCGIIIVIRRKTRVAKRAALVRLIDQAGVQGIAGNVNFA
jgi:predicted nuclease of predicted toxin-antitoxin system